ncbi:hypothetical protein [Deinococcus planocerae]|uniref:hypothetical protein n=1 Tax=Deinococcus planocerae TaxID=1737569 RepID=UPI000C7F2112|nr:hypothetical protein [Deinococcus planocerae]
MNAREWLEQATKEMPEAVRQRVQAETFAHLEDAGVGEGEDVRAVLGEPKVMRRELGRLYVPEDHLRALVEHNSTDLYYIVTGCVGSFMFFGFSSEPSPAYDGLLRQGILIVSSLWLLALFLTHTWPPVRLRVFHKELSVVALQAYLWLSFVSSFLSGDFSPLWWAAFLIWWPLALCRQLWKGWHQDQRLRRTLALVGGAQL